METRYKLAALLVTMILHLTAGACAFAQTNIDSLRELMREDAAERVTAGRGADIEAFITQKADREVSQAHRRGKSGNIQIRRGDTSGVDQEQLGEGNWQSMSVGSGD